MPEEGETASVTHHVWNEDRTALVPKNGEVDMSQPFFFVSDPVPADTLAALPDAWPSGWTEIGATTDPGEAPDAC